MISSPLVFAHSGWSEQTHTDPPFLKWAKFAPIRIVREGSSSNPGRCVLSSNPRRCKSKKEQNRLVFIGRAKGGLPLGAGGMVGL